MTLTPEKKELLKRLFEANQISFDELLLLLDVNTYWYQPVTFTSTGTSINNPNPYPPTIIY